jgi:S-methylmethionine-dependent homocysteine/selenocysteine methylase
VPATARVVFALQYSLMQTEIISDALSIFHSLKVISELNINCNQIATVPLPVTMASVVHVGKISRF